MEQIKPWKGIPPVIGVFRVSDYWYRSNINCWWPVQKYHGSDCDKIETTLECNTEFWEHLGWLPNQCGNSKLSCTYGCSLCVLNLEDCRQYLRIPTWHSVMYHPLQEVSFQDYCLLWTSELYYSSEHLLQNVFFTQLLHGRRYR